MKVVLINPTAGDYQLSYKYKKLLPPVPLLGICYIASVLEKNGFEVFVIDQYAYRLSNRELINEIEKVRPDVVGFSCLTPAINNARRLAERIKTLNHKIKIILGNLHPTLFADRILKEGTADAIVRGEGEYTALELISAFESGKDISHVGGISYCSQGRVIHNPDREQIKKLDDLPFPAWHLLNLKYYDRAPMLALPYCPLPVIGSRGCPYKCSFCAQDKVHKGFRIRKIKNVVDEIEYMHERFDMNGFGFCDSFFPSSIERGYEFCDELMSRGLNKKIRWTTEMRVDHVNEKLIKFMKKAGLHLIMFGFESGNQDILDSISKRTTIAQAHGAMEVVKKHGILTLGLFMMGMPRENIKNCEQTINFAKKLDCDVVKFNIFVPYPGTKIYEQHIKDIEVNPDFEAYTSWNTWLSKKKSLPGILGSIRRREIIWLQQKAMLSYYIRPKIIFRHLTLGTLKLSDILFGGIFLIYGFIKTLIINGFKNLIDKDDEIFGSH